MSQQGRLTERRGGKGVTGAAVVSLSFLVSLAVAAGFGLMPPFVAVMYAAVSGVLFLVYWADKAAAQRGGQRVPENTLHLLALVGGWPGALIARHLFRHKTRKQPFRTIFWGTVVVNCMGLIYVVASLKNSHS